MCAALCFAIFSRRSNAEDLTTRAYRDLFANFSYILKLLNAVARAAMQQCSLKFSERSKHTCVQAAGLWCQTVVFTLNGMTHFEISLSFSSY